MTSCLLPASNTSWTVESSLPSPFAKLGFLTRLASAVLEKPSVSKTTLTLRYLLQEKKFNTEYDKAHGLWKIGEYSLLLYDAPLKVNVLQDIPLQGRGQVRFTGGVLHQAEAVCAFKPIRADQAALAVGRYGNTLLVVDQQSALLSEVLS